MDVWLSKSYVSHLEHIFRVIYWHIQQWHAINDEIQTHTSLVRCSRNTVRVHILDCFLTVDCKYMYRTAVLWTWLSDHMQKLESRDLDFGEECHHASRAFFFPVINIFVICFKGHSPPCHAHQTIESWKMLFGELLYVLLALSWNLHKCVKMADLRHFLLLGCPNIPSVYSFDWCLFRTYFI